MDQFPVDKRPISPIRGFKKDTSPPADCLGDPVYLVDGDDCGLAGVRTKPESTFAGSAKE